jgi:hypothetical protein
LGDRTVDLDHTETLMPAVGFLEGEVAAVLAPTQPRQSSRQLNPFDIDLDGRGIRHREKPHLVAGELVARALVDARLQPRGKLNPGAALNEVDLLAAAGTGAISINARSETAAEKPAF